MSEFLKKVFGYLLTLTNMTTQPTDERVEKVVEEFKNTFQGCDQCQYGNGSGDWIEIWLRTTLTTLLADCERRVKGEAMSREKQFKQVHEMELNAAVNLLKILYCGETIGNSDLP